MPGTVQCLRFWELVLEEKIRSFFPKSRKTYFRTCLKKKQNKKTIKTLKSQRKKIIIILVGSQHIGGEILEIFR